MKTRYIAHIFKNQRGHGLLSVHAKSKVEAKRMADRIAKGDRCTCEGIETFTGYERTARRFAVDDYIWRNSPLMNRRPRRERQRQQ